jgi:hypothetical protein
MADVYTPEVMPTVSELVKGERLDHLKVRIGIDRLGHRVRPGLYALGSPDQDSRVLVTSNYTLSFDALRSSLPGRNAYILVLDTRGINVWCAAGKGTFGTEELLKAIDGTMLGDKVRHRTLTLPQLGAPGVCAREVKKASGFQVDFGPVRAEDLPEYLDTGECTEEMRTVRFDLRDRMVLTPVEIRNYRWALLMLILVAIFLPFYGLMVLALTMGGLFVFPALLPYLPGKELSLKGMVLGAILVTPFAVLQTSIPFETLAALAVTGEYLLLVPWAGYLALNFTGSTPFCSRSGVRKEIFTYIPIMAIMAVSGAVVGMIGALAVAGGWW